MTTPYERIAQARSRFVRAGIPDQDAAFDAEVLARHALGWDRAALVSRGRETAPPGFTERFDALVSRRVLREPVAYIVGHREFWGLEFEVTPSVLIPRSETELIVEEAIAFAKDLEHPMIVDVGTGSGCIGIAVAKELPRARVVATDASADALAVARTNAARLAARNIRFIRADVLSGVEVRANVIVSNPPYITAYDESTLPPEVSRYEPYRALFGGNEGLDVVRCLFDEARGRLAPTGRLIVEFGFGQLDAVQAAAVAAGWQVVRIRQDLQAIPRTIVLTQG